MPFLKRTLETWQQDSFVETLNSELNQLRPGDIPLHQCLARGSHVADDQACRFMLINGQEDTQSIKLKVGVFFNSVIAGCACADDPTPMDTCSEYGELLIIIDKQTAQCRFLVNDN